MFDIDASGSISEEKFLAFYSKHGEGKLKDDELVELFASRLQSGESILTKEAFAKFACEWKQVVKATPLADGISVVSSKVLRQLKPPEILEVVDGPRPEGTLDVQRIQVKALKDGVTGWATLA